MRIAIFSDIHGNLEALQAVMRHCDTCQVDRVVYLGDLVGYGPDPSRCIEAIRDVAELVLIGNHDLAVVSPSEISCRISISHWLNFARGAIV